MSNFLKYMHVEKVDSPECDGLLNNNNCIISTKLDGTNSCIWYDNEKEELCAGSRNRQLSAEADNAGFYAWTHSDNKEAIALKSFLQNHSQYIVYGEWLGQIDGKFVGSIKYYNPSALGKIWIFDVYDKEIKEYLPDSEWRPMLTSYGLDDYFVKILAELDHPTIEEIQEIAKNNKFLLDNNDFIGEGVVIRVPRWRNKYGHQVYGKLVLDEYKANKARKKKNDIADPEQYVIDNFVTDAEISKAIAKGCLQFKVDMFDKKDGRQVGFLLSTIWRDAVLAEVATWTKKLKNPTINFQLLKVKADEKVKEYIGL